MGIYHPKTSRQWWGAFQYQGKRQFVDLGITYLGKASDRKLAEEAYHNKRQEFIKGMDSGTVADPHLTLKELVDEYMRLHAVPNKKSADNDTTIFKQFYKFFDENCPVKRITPHSLEAYKTSRLAEVSRGKKISGTRINRELATLKSMFSKAVLWGKVADNPVKRVKLFKEDNKRERFLNAKEKDMLLRLSPDWMRPILVFALNTGMRQAEILDLKWADVNLSQNVLLVQNSKSGKPRYIPLNSTLAEMLKRHPKRGLTVFCNERGMRFNRHGMFRTYFEKLREKVMSEGVPAFVFHDLRHTFASDLAMKGADIKAISELLGHSTIRMSERYMHLSPNHKRVAVELLVTAKNQVKCEDSVNVNIHSQGEISENS